METTTSSGVSEESLNQPWAYYVGFDLPWTTSTSQAVVVIVEAIVAMLICWILPRFTTIIPSSLVALVLITVANIVTQEPNQQWVMPTVGDYCLTELPTSRVWLPIFTSSYSLPALSEWETIRAVFPTGILLFCINLLETMVCLNVADNYTNHDSEQDRVFYGQGLANMVCGLMGGMSGAGMAHTTLFGLREGGMTSISTFIAGVMMLFVITFAYPAISFVPLGAVMGVTLHLLLNMIQWTPMIAFILKFIPSSCLMDKPSLLKRRLSTPDVFSTMGTSIFTLCASTYGLAGYFVGVICYACDPIAHAIIISGENEHNYRFVELSLPKASNQRIKSKDEQSSEDGDEDSDVSGREYIKQESKAIEVIEHHIERSLYDEKV